MTSTPISNWNSAGQKCASLIASYRAKCVRPGFLRPGATAQPRPTFLTLPAASKRASSSLTVDVGTPNSSATSEPRDPGAETSRSGTSTPSALRRRRTARGSIAANARAIESRLIQLREACAKIGREAFDEVANGTALVTQPRPPHRHVTLRRYARTR